MVNSIVKSCEPKFGILSVSNLIIDWDLRGKVSYLLKSFYLKIVTSIKNKNYKLNFLKSSTVQNKRWQEFFILSNNQWKYVNK